MEQINKLNHEELVELVTKLRYENNQLKRSKKYGLVWEDTKEVLDTKPVIPMIKKEESMNVGNINEEPRNYLIEGDNYHALKVLQHTHKNKVDVIYIDPPYNTGNEFVYNDKIVDKEDNFRHSKWLSFMDKRLRLAKNLMRDDGVIFISIDDNEQAQLKLLMDEIFGEHNKVTNIVWLNNLKGRSFDKFFSETYETILVYAKNIKEYVVKDLEVTDEKVLRSYKFEDEISKYKKGHAFYNSDSKFNIQTRNNLAYTIYFDKETEEIITINETVTDGKGEYYLPEVEYDKEKYIRITPPLRKTNNLIGCWRWQESKLLEDYKTEIIKSEIRTKGMLYIKDRLDSDGKKMSKHKNIITGLDTNKGTNQLTEIMQDKVFDSPKSSDLIKILLKTVVNQNATVLDFFAGSGTTGHSVMELNKEDGGKRSFILCTNNEVSEEKVRQYFISKGLLDKNTKTAFNKFKKENPELVEEFYESEEYKQLGIARSVTRERIKRVSEGYTTPKGVKVEGLGGNLEYFVTEEFIEEDVYGFNRNQLAELALNSHSIKYPTNIYQNILVNTFTNLDEVELDKTKKPAFLINARDNETLSQRMDEITSKFGTNTILHSINDYYEEI